MLLCRPIFPCLIYSSSLEAESSTRRNADREPQNTNAHIRRKAAIWYLGLFPAASCLVAYSPIRPIYVDTNGPFRTFVNRSSAAVQLPQSRHWSMAQQFRGVKDCNAGRNELSLRLRKSKLPSRLGERHFPYGCHSFVTSDHHYGPEMDGYRYANPSTGN